MLEALVQRVAGIAAKVAAKPDTRWGVVTGINPLRVRLDADDAPLLGSPSAVVTGLSTGDRVLCLVQNRRVTVIGRGQGAENKVLWTGAMYMNANQVASFTESAFDQETGIVLVWKFYRDGSASNEQIVSTFIPKGRIRDSPGSGQSIYFQTWSATNTGQANYQKYIYVSHDRVAGHSINNSSPANNHVLTAVLGV